MRIPLLAFVAIGLLAAADHPSKDTLKKEYAKFQGTWKFVSIEAQGMKVPQQQIKTPRLVIAGDKFTMTEDIATYRGNFKLDPSKKPKTIDVIFTEGPEKGNTSLGIYELEGDVYKVCISLGKDRPKEFVSKAGSSHVLEVLHREKR